MQCRRWSGKWLRGVLPLLLVVMGGVDGSAPVAQAGSAAGPLEAAFARESYPPRSTATVRLYSATRLATVQIFRSGTEQGRTRARDVMRGVAVDRRRWVGTRPAGSAFSVHLGAWPSGLYFARLSAPGGLLAFAPFLHWMARTGKRVDVLSDEELRGARSGRRLAKAYDLVVFAGHHEYVTDHEYGVIRQYRNAGGNLMFLFANDFLWRIAIRGDVMTRMNRWRDLGRPEAALIGVQYRGNDRGRRKGAWVVRQAASTPRLFAGTGLGNGSHIGRGGIEIDARSTASPRNLHVLAEIPNLYGPGFTAQMTYYTTRNGAKVFAARAFDLVESILEPDKPLPDPAARDDQAGSRRFLENLWAALSKP